MMPAGVSRGVCLHISWGNKKMTVRFEVAFVSPIPNKKYPCTCKLILNGTLQRAKSGGLNSLEERIKNLKRKIPANELF
jgi:hypothetical protein